VKTIVIVKFCCLGDAILMGPALRTIRAAYTNAEITIVTTAKTSGVFPSLASIDRIVELPLSGNPLTLLKSLRASVPDRAQLLYCFEPWYPTATLVSYAMRASHSIGFTSPRAPYNQSFFNRVVPYKEDRHVVETYRRLAEAGIQGNPARQELQLSIGAEADRRVAAFFQRQGLHGDVIALFAGGSPTWIRKRWPTDKFGLLADRITSELGMRVLLLTGKGQESVNEEVCAQMREQPVVSPGDFSVGELAAAIRRCRLIVSSDSSPIHIASAVGTPVVAMFGPVPSITYRPYLPSEAFRVVSKNLPCSPCVVFAQSPPCPYDFECIRSISVEEVLAAVKSVMAFPPHFGCTR
jgi:heptosyltransferase-2